MRMVESKGKLIYCPFRTRKCRNGNIETTDFMPCMKEDCICYNQYEYDGVVTESCYRDNIGYLRTWNKEEDI